MNKALPKKVLNEIKSILGRIASGELDHNQGNWHCGTAHCLAGWKETLDAKKICPKVVSVGQIFIGSLYTLAAYCPKLEEVHGSEYRDAGEYAQARWILNNDEAESLFNSDNTVESMLALVAYLETGKRMKDSALFNGENFGLCYDDEWMEFLRANYPDFVREY